MNTIYKITEGANFPDAATTVSELVNHLSQKVSEYVIYLEALPDGNHVVELGTYKTDSMCDIPVMVNVFGDYLVESYIGVDLDEKCSGCVIQLSTGDFVPAFAMKRC